MKSERSTNQLLDHFVASGLDEKALTKMHVTLIPAHSDKAINLPVDCARLPYFDLNGQLTAFYRLRTLSEWIPEGEVKPRRYMQTARSGNHLYLPPLLDVTWMKVAEDTTRPILITEGEKKAACGCLHGFATIGLGGVWNWRSGGAAIHEFDLFKWKNRTVYIAFDSDIRSNEGVTAACERLSAELRRRGAHVMVVLLPSPDGRKVGLDDLLVMAGKDARECLNRILEKAEQFLDPVSEVNETLATVWFGAKTLILRETFRSDGTLEVDFARSAEVRPGYADRFLNIPAQDGIVRIQLFDHWLKSKSHRRYDRVVFEPAGCPANEYNLWRGLSVSPAVGECSLFLHHIRENLCLGDTLLYDYVIGWLAHLVQKPGELPGTALVIRGRQGTGKGVFAHTVGALIKDHFLHMSSQRHLLGNFNGHTKAKLLFFADEAFWAGDKAAEGTLKALVTEPTRILEHKGRDALIINNYTRLIVASNHDWVVPAGMEERRFVVLDVSPAHMQDTEYFDKLTAQMNTQGLAALLDHLLKVDLSSVDLRQIPKTAALLDTKLQSLTGVHGFWYECLSQGCNGDTGGVWQKEVSCSRLHELYIHKATEIGHSRRAAQSELGKALKKLVPGLVDIRRRSAGTNAQERHWVFPSLDECRAAFCTELGQNVEWEAPVPPPTRKKRSAK